MNKKVLLIALALVVAFAGSAVAAVNFGGNFTVKMEADSLTLDEGFVLTPSASIAVSASNKSEREDDELNWDFSATFNADDLKLGSKYKLSLFDQHFTAHVWGGQNLADKATPFGFITAGKAGGTGSVRLIVPVVDIVDVTLDFRPKDTLRAFVDGKLEGFDVGLAYALKGWTGEPDHVIGVYGAGAVEGFNLEADAAAKLGDDLGFAVGFGVDTLVTDELKLEGSVAHLNNIWTGDKASTTLEAGATYTETEFQVAANVAQTLKEDANENEINLGAKYRMGEAVGFANLFNRNPALGATYYNLDAPAFGVSVVFKDLEFGGVTVNAASPVVEDMAWVHAQGTFTDKDNFGANLEGHVAATDKLTLKPFASYANEGQVIDAKLTASYKIGLSDTVLTLVAQKVFTEEGFVDADGEAVAKELLSASVTVPF